MIQPLSKQQYEQKDRVRLRIISAVKEYYEVFGKPIGMNVLSAKFSRALQKLGGFPELMEFLKENELIQVSMRETGGKDVWPARAKAQLPEDTVMLSTHRDKK